MLIVGAMDTCETLSILIFPGNALFKWGFASDKGSRREENLRALSRFIPAMKWI